MSQVTAQPELPSPVTVVIVDDSATQRRFIRAAMASDPMLEVVGEARTGRDAVALVERLQPTAVIMDLHLPVMNGIEAIERIMANRPTPIVVYSAFVNGADRDNAASALAAGAIDVMAKPGPEDSARLSEYAEELRQKLRVAGRVRVITHPRGRLGVTRSSMTTARLDGTTEQPPPRTASRRQPPPRPNEPSALLESLSQREFQLLVIGASTGGPQALATLLADLPRQTATAIVVIQHMADGFMEGLSHWLDDVCPLPVVLGEHGKRLAQGTVTIAPGAVNLVIHDHLRITTSTPPPTQYHVPGIDVTFTSAAEAYGSMAAGVLLTGMGRDGATGLKRVRDRGGLTIGQDESTSAVYGMPAAAMSEGAVDLQLPLPDISVALHRILSPVDDGGRRS
ncbi:MAG TPA: chemotaxis-specific protein-glutamate methyltransferase CheB [Mycobacteriales bacterium]|nr:chemotaxis-specific protein-glutamate methyltransferase CheB [Mycobacteriales bacterium]